MQLTADRNGERLDVFLARKLPEYSRSFWQKVCTQGSITRNDKVIRANSSLREGDSIRIPSLAVQPQGVRELPILYEDDDVLVIDKPSGILTHAKGVVSDEFTLADFIRPRTRDNAESNRPGIVHRLDRDTSGVLISAKSNEAKRWLQKQFAERKVKKAYIALVIGHLKQPHATLDLPIERNPRSPQMFRVGANGRPAQTTYETMEILPHYTLLKLFPHTGRTHQLRVHMAYLNHPIVGDNWYGEPDKRLHRLFLHAAELEITLPSRQRRLFTAPLPPELENYLEQVR